MTEGPLRHRIRVVSRRVLSRNMTTFVTMTGIILIASACAIYILQQQRLRIPLIDEKPFIVKAEFSDRPGGDPRAGPDRPRLGHPDRRHRPASS